MRLRLALGFAVAVGTLAASARGAPGDETADVGDAARRVAELKEDVLALRTLRAMAPTRPQAETLLGLSREALATRVAFDAQRGPALRLQKAAFLRFLAEDQADEGFRPETERATSRAVRSGEALEDAYAVRLNALAERAWAILGPDQRRALVHGPPEARAGVAAKPFPLLERAEAWLAEVRRLPELEYRPRERAIATEALVRLGAPPDTDRAALTESLVEWMRRYRAVPAAELPALRERIYERVFPGLRAMSIQRELRRIHDDRRPSPGGIGRWLANKAVCAALVALVDRLPSPDPDDPVPPAETTPERTSR